MRLSEAIRLGSLAIKPQAHEILDGEAGCAIGMGFYATGCRSFMDINRAARSGQWGWIMQRPLLRPEFCECAQWSPRYEHIELDCYADYRAWVAHWFNEHVMGEAFPHMTLEALCDQVRAWEDELAAKGINVEQVTMIATPEATHEPAAEHSHKPEYVYRGE